MECPILVKTDKTELVKLLIEKDQIISELLDENKKLKEWYDSYREEQDKDDWSC